MRELTTTLHDCFASAKVPTLNPELLLDEVLTDALNACEAARRKA